MEGSTGQLGKTVGVLFIDFKKVFDYVYHKILSVKMQACELTGNLLDWLNNYLEKHRQFVENRRSEVGYREQCLLSTAVVSLRSKSVWNKSYRPT